MEIINIVIINMEMIKMRINIEMINMEIIKGKLILYYEDGD